MKIFSHFQGKLLKRFLQVKMVLELLTRLASTPTTTSNANNINSNESSHDLTNSFNTNTKGGARPNPDNNDVDPSIEEPPNVSQVTFIVIDVIIQTMIINISGIFDPLITNQLSGRLPNILAKTNPNLS